jgi:hypothetical protein
MVVGALTGHRIRYFEVTSGGGVPPASTTGGVWGDPAQDGRPRRPASGSAAQPSWRCKAALLGTLVVLLVLALIKAEKE